MSIDISCETGTRIKSIKCGSKGQNYGFSTNNNLDINGWDIDLAFWFPDRAITALNSNIWEHGLSVDFVRGGVLTYIPNKNYINP